MIPRVLLTLNLSVLILILGLAIVQSGCDSRTEVVDEGELPNNEQVLAEEIVWEKDEAVMRLIPAGEFEMGDHFNEGDIDERPVHTVFLDDFYMDATEVTNAQYAMFLNAMVEGQDDVLKWRSGESIELVGGVYLPWVGYADHPVVSVSWNAAVDYAQWAGKRLPTEAEWEKAARGGLVGKRYPWGNDVPDAGDTYRANYGYNPWDNLAVGDHVADGYERTAPVGSFPPNGYRLYDMSGNVNEWCMDENLSNFYANSPRNNPVGGGLILFVNDNFGKVEAYLRVIRGGSFANSAFTLRVAYRDNMSALTVGRTCGFRCAGSVTP